MPFTAYHFGPNGFFGLVFKKWIDLPVFVLANVVVDLEVLFYNDWPVHRYFHTLLIGAAVGAIWGLIAYPLKSIFKKIMRSIRISYSTNLRKMIISGILGVWLHILIDAFYHWDVRIFWPSNSKPLFGLMSKYQVEILCIAFAFASVALYFALLLKQKK
jgi:membrane-bound metal-dependent hydrolase YbcI (DUF457 family)